MPIETLSKQEAAEQLRESLSDEVPALTNFIEGTANNQITEQGIGGFVERITHLGLAAQLSGWVDTAGGPITADKLETVGIEPSAVDIDLLQQYTNRSDLDALAEQNGVERDPGEFATGEVLFVTNTAETEIPAGTELYTGALVDGTRYGYQTTETVSPTGVQTNVIAPIEALSRGASSNVGSGSINTFFGRPTGVESVTNPDATSGGEDEESNASLRRRTRTALTRTSGGGTVRGMEGSIERAFDDVDLNDVLVVEHPGKSVPPYDDAPLNEQGDKAAISWGEVVVDSAALNH